ADSYPLVGNAQTVQLPISAVRMLGETGEFVFTTDASGTPAKTLKVLGLPAGATVNRDSYFVNAGERGSGKLFIDVAADTKAGRYPMELQLGSDDAFSDRFNLYVQEFSISPNHIDLETFQDVGTIKITVTGRYLSAPAGDFTISVPGPGYSDTTMYFGIQSTATPFIVNADGTGSGTITLTGAPEWQGNSGSYNRSLSIGAGGCSVTLTMPMKEPLGIIWTDLPGNMIRVKPGDIVDIPVSGDYFLIVGGKYPFHASFDGLRSPPAVPWWGDPDPVVIIPKGLDATLDTSIDVSWVQSNHYTGKVYGTFRLNIGKGAKDADGVPYMLELSFGSAKWGSSNDRNYWNFFVVVE
ncbi:MAG: hypothetical protein FWD94_04855, partial [Treponema sp.]|nr:hypothetical protein [Treponema sp.]